MESLHQQIGQLPDCRKRRGIRHHDRTVLTIAIAAVVCGARSFTALGEFAAMLTQAQLKRLSCRFDTKIRCHQPPSESTLRRVLQASDAEALDRFLGQWLLAQSEPDDPLTVDGKTLCGARRKDGSKVHLLSAFLHQQGGTVAQIDVVYAITSLTSQQATPTRLLHLNRGHWSIENRSHYVRDMAYDEDR